MSTPTCFSESRLARGLCPSCEVVRINGVKCHEHGCPEAWRDEVRECKWCGQDFKPTESGQRFCEDSCAESFNH